MSSAAPPMTIEALLASSRAHPMFAADVLSYAAHRPSSRLVVVGHPPRTKVLRVLCQLLSHLPDVQIETVRLRGSAGCSDFRGEITATANGAERTWDFVWDCRWRARQAGLLDMLGFPDQERAAREFGWQCFALWAERIAETESSGG